MRISTIGYSMKQGVKNIRRNKMFSVASIATMAACIFLFGLFYSIVVNFSYIVEKAEEGVDVTASYNGLSATVTVKVPALQAGQFATLTPTIILQEEDAETKIVAESTKLEPVTDPKVKTWDNYELYWFDIPSFPYVVKEGAKVGAKKINTTDLIERAAIESFFNTLENTYEETTVTTPENKYKVYANSRTTASITYTVVTTEYKVVKKAVTKAETEPLASIEVDDYTTSTLFVLENQDIPGHGHSHGHGHGHGEGNAGGGVGELD